MSFQQALSGLNATAKNLEIIGNNIANANTFGSKTARAEFADAYAAALNGSGSSEIGIGTELAAVAQQFNQGNITATGNAMDLAINGAGFFQITDGSNQTMYSRNGQFKVDRDGYIVNNQAMRLMGYPADNTGTIQPGNATALRLPTAGIAPQSTTKVALEVNLDARAAVTAPLPPAAPIDFADPTTYNNVTSLNVFDALGQDVTVTYYFQKASAGTWNVFATANGTPLAGTAAAPLPTTTMTFSNTGALTAPTTPLSIDVPATTNANGVQTVAVNGIVLDVTQATQFGSAFGVTSVTQDGYAPGQITGIGVEDNGIITARYSNGQSKPAGQIELANFRNMQGLQPLGGNAWARSHASGEPVVGVPGEGNLGMLQAGALEESNVDLTAELVNMMTAQRIYQANAQTIRTQDQVLQTLVQLR